MLGQLAGQVISLGVLAALYRLVDPVEFGVLGMFMPLVLLARSFGSLGMDIATVQRRDLTNEQATTLFWYQIASGAAISLLLAGLSPLLAMWFRADRLLAVGLVLSGTALLTNSYSQHKALAERKLHFGRLTLVRLLSLLVSGLLAIAAAWNGWGVWALVVQQYTELAVLNVGHWIAEPWRPRKLAPAAEVRHLLSFSGFYTFSGLCFALGQNLDKILLSVLLGGSETGRAWIGYYTQAYNQMIRPVYLLTAPVTAAMLPALSQAATDRATLTRLTGEFYRMVGIMLAPVSVGLFLVGQRLMPVLGGKDWTEAGQLLSILGLMVLAQSWINICGSLMSAVGKANLLALGGLVSLVVLALATGGAWLVAGSEPGLLTQALTIAITLATVLSCGPYLVFCFHASGSSPGIILQQLAPAVVAAALMGVVVYGVGFTDPFLPTALTLVLQVAVGVAAYVLLARREVAWLWQQLRGGRETD